MTHLVPYQKGTRISRTTGETVYVFEFKTAPANGPLASHFFKEFAMDTLETFLSTMVIKVLHKASPNLTADDDAKATKAVQDFVTTAMDLAAVYFALRNAKK